jgi:hypothetical protein
MGRKLSDIIPGFAIFILIAAVVGFSISMGIFPGGIEEWLSGSAAPRQALIFFSIIFSSVFMILARSGVEINLFNIAKGESIKRYVSGLPLWALFIVLAGSIVGFWNYSPRCKAPEAVVFEILGRQETYLPLDIIEVSPNESFTITAKSPDENILLSCISWEFVGPAFLSLGEKNGCGANVTFSGERGSSFISLLATQNFCDRASLFSLEVKVK